MPTPETPAQKFARTRRRATLSLGYNNGMNSASYWRTSANGFQGFNNTTDFNGGMARQMANLDPRSIVHGTPKGMGFPTNFSAAWNGFASDTIYRNLATRAPVIYTGKGGAANTVT